ncbi:MAG: nitrite/sulfite reductase [Cellulosilyticaceae bacterium]
MDSLNKQLLDELAYFKECGEKFLNKELSKMDFKKISGGFGVYAQRDEIHFMVRLRFSSGTLSLNQLAFVSELVSLYNLSYIHFTTRQTIQLHDLTLDQVCTIIALGIQHGIYTRGAGGNFPRNVAISPLSGVSPNEPFDITPYALAVGNYFMQQVLTYHLPRKFKVSFANTPDDAPHSTIQDLGFVATLLNDVPSFEVYLGGGLGQSPALGIKLPAPIPAVDTLYHVEALLRLFIAEGDYSNRNKARIRFIVMKLGQEAFLSKYQHYLEEAKSTLNLALNPTPICYATPGCSTTTNHPRLFPQKQPGLYSVYFQPLGGILPASTLHILLDLLSTFNAPLIRLTLTEGMYILNLNGNEALQLIDSTEKLGMNYELEQSIACIGPPTCQIGVAHSQSLLKLIIDYFREQGITSSPLPRIYISGCPNSCGVHQISHIGLVGSKKRIEGELMEVFNISLGGSFHLDGTRLGTPIGSIVYHKIPQVLFALHNLLISNNWDWATALYTNLSTLENCIKPYLI